MREKAATQRLLFDICDAASSCNAICAQHSDANGASKRSAWCSFCFKFLIDIKAIRGQDIRAISLGIA